MQSARLWERALGFAADDKGNQASISRRQASHRTTLQFSSANFEDARLERLEESSVSHMFTSRHLSIGDVTLKRYKNDLQADKIWKEFDLLQDTHNERVVRMFGAFFDGSPYLVLEPLLGNGRKSFIGNTYAFEYNLLTTCFFGRIIRWSSRQTGSTFDASNCPRRAGRSAVSPRKKRSTLRFETM